MEAYIDFLVVGFRPKQRQMQSSEKGLYVSKIAAHIVQRLACQKRQILARKQILAIYDIVLDI